MHADSSYPGQEQLNLGYTKEVKFLDYPRIISFSTQALLRVHLICELVSFESSLIKHCFHFTGK